MMPNPSLLSDAARLSALVNQLNLYGLTALFVGAVLLVSARQSVRGVGAELTVLGAAVVLLASAVQNHWLVT